MKIIIIIIIMIIIITIMKITIIIIIIITITIITTFNNVVKIDDRSGLNKCCVINNVYIDNINIEESNHNINNNYLK